MNFDEGLRIVDAAIFSKINRHLKDVEILVLKGSWQGLNYDEIAIHEGYAAKYLRQDVGFKLWKLLSDALGEEVNKTNFQAAVERSRSVSPGESRFNSTNILPIEIQQLESLDQIDSQTNNFVPEYPEGSVPLDSLFYVQRQIDIRCYEKILQSGSLIRIKAPHQMGKTSFCDRIISHSNQQGYNTVRLNVSQAEAQVFSDLDKFLRWFCAYVSYKLKLPSLLNESWDEYRGSIINCTTYFEENILMAINNNLVLSLDEADIIFQYPEISQGFFSMLRSWHEKAKTVDIWEKLWLIVVNSTENYGSLDINQSPFNVGLVVELTEFSQEQIEDLAQRHQLDYNQTQVQQLMSMLGGHPYLIRLAFYHLVLEDITLENLLQNAPTNGGIYEEYLRRILNIFQANNKLAANFIEVVNATEAVGVETMQAYQLYSMGLVKRIGDKLVPRCQLYRKYFREHLNK
ncbi:AAA-like domain-containing protein [Brunnivagina elsteri]|uniref:Serine/threonine protein kinase n=1 Tax=Brunnivagina elsteri CCALA 953 TaxID=987040 RepID=A0A2A2TCX4_9CYAN|nr:AAA-like domain-containing protein [Calothrix elsteri]PAX51563.1 serine/threonine protein kinase [Calothrix elsteri CCALA 953]